MADGLHRSEPNVQAARGGEQVVPSPREKPERERKSALREVVETIALAIVIFVAVRSVVLNYRVDGTSMVPTLQNGEMLIVGRRAYSHIDLAELPRWLPGVTASTDGEWYVFDPPRRGDIIVFHPPGASSEPYIKRIIALPGEQVAIRDGAVFVNGHQLDEPYVSSPTVWRGIGQDTVTVPPDSVFVLGDNRANSSDSRVFGPVPMSSIIGKAWVAYWPPDAVQVIANPTYALE